MKYLFGDSDLAARRLAVLADVFGETSRMFLSRSAGQGQALAIDLGCGPGRTTHLLAKTLGCTQTIGLDKSEHFIRLAEHTAAEGVRFHLHDVTVTPLPVGPADVIFARFLLTHQHDSETLIARWGAQLDPGGTILLEEVDAIDTQVGPFAEYLRIVEAMLARDGCDLYVGPGLDAMPAPASLTRRASRVGRLPVTTDRAARMFSMNIETWKHNEYVRENCPPAAIRRLEAALADLAAAPTAETTIEWRLRQLVFEREK